MIPSDERFGQSERNPSILRASPFNSQFTVVFTARTCLSGNATNRKFLYIVLKFYGRDILRS